jgi:hypothetical protein
LFGVAAALSWSSCFECAMWRDCRRAAFSDRSSFSGIDTVFTGEAKGAACGFPEARTRGMIAVEARECTCCWL